MVSGLPGRRVPVDTAFAIDGGERLPQRPRYRLGLADDQIATPPQRPSDGVDHRLLVLAVDVDGEVATQHQVQVLLRVVSDEVVSLELDGAFDPVRDGVAVAVDLDVPPGVVQEGEFVSDVGGV